MLVAVQGFEPREVPHTTPTDSNTDEEKKQ
jgi:hypothetical protein